MTSDAPCSAAEELIRRIERAFVKVRLEGGVSMAQARAKDDWKLAEESLRARKQDREKSWLDIADEKIERYCDVMSWLDAKGYRFYLPAFMRWKLRHPASSNYAGEGLVRSLCPVEVNKKGVKEREFAIDRYKLLNREQREVVCEFLAFIAADEAALEEARQALDHYWKK